MIRYRYVFKVYDRCFTNFFEHFISPEYSQNSNANPCEQIYESYRRCVEKRLTESQLYDIDLEELRRRVLNTDDDRLRDHQEKEKSQVSFFFKSWKGTERRK
ncbi:unnamed protein product [Toxocara canis]|uniref:Uncharacterized protein n=1 Tax=Toxocara canis TaxID=6265 RepID=A0A183U3X0_TOXCA|nr:unnamed protein product [Toxocara canis]